MAKSREKEIRELAEAIVNDPKSIGMAHIPLFDRVLNALSATGLICEARGRRDGIKAAAAFIDQWTGQPQKHRLGDVILYKFNLTKRTPRLTRTKPQVNRGNSSEKAP